MFLKEYIEMTEIPATFADFLDAEICARDISTYHEQKIIDAFKLVAKSEPGPWRDTLKTKAYKIACVKHDDGLKWEVRVVGCTDDNFVSHVLAFLEQVNVCERLRVNAMNTDLWFETLLPVEMQTSRFKDLLRQYASRGREFIESNIDYCRKNAKTSPFSFLSMCFESDYGKDTREVNARREEIAAREAEKVANEKNRYIEMDRQLARVKELPEETYKEFYQRAKDFLVEKAGKWSPEFMKDEIIERIMTDYLPKESDLRMVDLGKWPEGGTLAE